MSEKDELREQDAYFESVRAWSEHVSTSIATIMQQFARSTFMESSGERPIYGTRQLKSTDSLDLIESDTQRSPGEIARLKLCWYIKQPEYERDYYEHPNDFKVCATTDVQEGSDCNIIDERIVATDSMLSSGELVLRNFKNGTFIDFLMTVPPHTFFIPSSLPLKEDFECMYEEAIRLLRDYKGQSVDGAVDGEHGFMANSTYYGKAMMSHILYKSLSKKGGVLNLLHEIAHAWQGYVNDATHGAFISNVIKFIEWFSEYDCEDKELSTQKTVEYIQKINKAHNVRFHNIYVYGEDLPNVRDGESIFISYAGFIVHFSSNKAGFFDKALAINRWKERNAWFCAIRVVAYLRRVRKFDVEPLMTDKDMVSHAHECLRTYDDFMSAVLRHDSRTIMYS